MCSLVVFQNGQLESTIDRHYVGRRKCGNVLISLDVKLLSLHCIFCEFDNDELDTFLDHLRNEHWNLVTADGLFLEPYEEKLQVKEEISEAEETKFFDIKPDIQEADPLMPKEKNGIETVKQQHYSTDSDDIDDDYEPPHSIKINNAISNRSNESVDDTQTDNRIRDVDVLRLIELIQGHPILWSSQICYKRSKYKTAIEIIAKKMVEEFPNVKIDYQYVRKKLNKLKRMYYNYNKSGQKHTQKEAICFQKLHFLKGHGPIKGKKKEKECPLCCIVFKNLSEHMSRCHEEGDTRQACKLCDQILPSQRRLKMHLRSVHRRFECEHCDTVYASLKSIKKHMRRDHTDKPQLPMHGLEKESLENVCEYCGKKFNFRQCLSNHIKNVHLQLRPYVCTECSKAYKAKDKLKSHINSVHLNIRPFVCDVCSRAFYDRKTMMQHKRIHSDVKNYACKLCASAFRQASSLNSHMKTHQTMLDS